MGLFSGLKDAKRLDTARDPAAKVGHYLVRIDGFKKQKSKKPPFGDFTALEYTIVKVLDDDSGAAHKVGHEGVDLMLNYGNQSQVFMQKMVGALCGCMNGTEGELSEEDGEAAVGPQQPLKGLVVELRVVPKPFTDAKTKEQRLAQNRSWRRSLPQAEAQAELAGSPEVLAKYFPNGIAPNPFAGDEVK